tara:strand:- start:228 stop:815 length:588 start_codon:yes stop_codon:yes gene_type:complete
VISSRDLKTGRILPGNNLIYGYKIKYLGPNWSQPRWLVDGQWTSVVPDKDRPQRRKQLAAYYSMETPYFKKIFNKMKKSRHKVEFESWKELLEHWHQQRAIYGMRCPITGDLMTMIRKMEKGNQGVRTRTNISPDRLLSSMNYTKQNVLFVTVEFNLAKGPLKGHRVHHLFNSQIADNYLKILRERFPGMEYEDE